MSDVVLVDFTDGVAKGRLSRPGIDQAPNDDFAALVDVGQSLEEARTPVEEVARR